MLKKQYQQIIAARHEAEQASQAKTQFLANMSHEIRTPMNGILGTIKLLGDLPLDEKPRRYLDILALSGKNLMVILNDILDFSKIDADKMQLEITRCQISVLIDYIASNMQARAQENNVTLSYDIAEDIPQLIYIDETRVSQVLNNLVSNAIKFTEHGRVSITATTFDKDGSAWLNIRVTDTGIGIETDTLERLFTAFEQADASTTRKYGGTGLGLTISKKLVELMGGELHVDSKYGIGSTFSFTTPYTSDDSQQELEIEKHHADTRQHRLNPNLKILIAEDNAVNQIIAMEFINSLGLQADIADNGQIALDKLSQKHYDIVFMDMQMPVMDGIEATHNICNNYPPSQRPVIIALTANTQQRDIDECLAAGMSDFLSKPLDMDKIIDILVKWQPKPDDQVASR